MHQLSSFSFRTFTVCEPQLELVNSISLHFHNPGFPMDQNALQATFPLHVAPSELQLHGDITSTYTECFTLLNTTSNRVRFTINTSLLPLKKHTVAISHSAGTLHPDSQLTVQLKIHPPDPEVLRSNDNEIFTSNASLSVPIKAVLDRKGAKEQTFIVLLHFNNHKMTMGRQEMAFKMMLQAMALQVEPKKLTFNGKIQ